MKYKKGTFVIIPNKDYLKGKPSEMQAIYFWLCEHANEKGSCFPTKKTLAEEAGCSHNTLDKYLGQLVEEGFLEVKPRKIKGTKENTSNLYQLLIVSKMVKPTTKSGMTGSPNIGSETVSSINSIHLTTTPPKVEEEFDFKKEMQKLSESKWKPNKIIHLYFKKKGFSFTNKLQWETEYKRNLRPAKELEGYNSSQIEATMDYLDNQQLTWTLYAIGRNIANVANKKQ